MHVQLAIVATLYQNLNASIKNHDYWLNFKCGNLNTKGTKLQQSTKKHRAISPHFVHLQLAERHKVKATICYAPSNSVS